MDYFSNILVTTVCLLLTMLYTATGVVAVGKCPIRPELPYWALGTGSLLGVGAPLLVCFYSRHVGPYLKNSVNEDLYPDFCDGLTQEARHSGGGKCKLALLVVLAMVGISWWFYGSYLVYSIYWTVTTSQSETVAAESNESALLVPTHCDAVVYYLSMEMQTLSWLVLSLAVLW